MRYVLNTDLFKYMVPRGGRMAIFAAVGLRPTCLWNYYQGRTVRDKRKRQMLADKLCVLVTRLWKEK